MRKFINCDILAVLGEILSHNTEHWREDIDIDKEILSEAAEEKDRNDRRFLWMSRSCGTHCLKEKDVYLRGTSQHNAWRFYDEETNETVIAYAVEIDGLKDGVLRGNLYELDYHASSDFVRRCAVSIGKVKLYGEDGSEKYLTYEEDWYSKVQEFSYVKRDFIPNNESGYDAVLAVAKSDRLTARNYANWNLEKLKMEYGDDSSFAFSIYQLKSDEHRFDSYSHMQTVGYAPVVFDYDMIYTDRLNGATLNDIYERFNINAPEEYIGYSLSVSDVVVLIQNGERKAYIIDSIGFKELTNFFKT